MLLAITSDFTSIAVFSFVTAITQHGAVQFRFPLWIGPLLKYPSHTYLASVLPRFLCFPPQFHHHPPCPQVLVFFFIARMVIYSLGCLKDGCNSQVIASLDLLDLFLMFSSLVVFLIFQFFILKHRVSNLASSRVFPSPFCFPLLLLHVLRPRVPLILHIFIKFWLCSLHQGLL